MTITVFIALSNDPTIKEKMGAGPKPPPRLYYYEIPGKRGDKRLGVIYNLFGGVSSIGIYKTDRT